MRGTPPTHCCELGASKHMRHDAGTCGGGGEAGVDARPAPVLSAVPPTMSRRVRVERPRNVLEYGEHGCRGRGLRGHDVQGPRALAARNESAWPIDRGSSASTGSPHQYRPMFFAKLWSTSRSRPRAANMRTAHASASRSPVANPCSARAGWGVAGGLGEARAAGTRTHLVRDVEPRHEAPLCDDVGDGPPLLPRRVAASRVVRAAVQEDDGALRRGAEVGAEACKVEPLGCRVPVAVGEQRAELHGGQRQMHQPRRPPQMPPPTPASDTTRAWFSHVGSLQ